MGAKSFGDKEIRDRFVALRNRMGWSQQKTADELGVKQPSVAAWESGSKPTPQRHLSEMARRAGETLAYFLGAEAPDDERREKLIAARWLRRLADQLQGEATGPARATEPAAMDPVQAMEVASEAEPRAAPDGKRAPRRPGPGNARRTGGGGAG